MPDVSTIRVILPQNQVVSINAGTVLPSPGFSLNATSISVSLVAGNNISFSSHLSTITIAGAAAQAFTLNGSTGSASLIAGNNITLQSNASSITIIGPSAGAAGFSLNASTGSVSLVAGANLTINSGASSMTLVGPTVPTATNFSLNGSSSSVSLVAGANIGFASGASSVTISASNQTSSLSYVAALGTAGALSSGSITLVAGNNVTLQTGANAITISAAATAGAATQSISANGTSVTGTAVSLDLEPGVNVNFTTATAAGKMSITMGLNTAIPTVPVVTAIGTAGALSAGSIVLVAGNNITLNTGASSITVVGPASFSTVSISASGNTTGATSSGTFNNVLAFSGMGAASVGAGNGTVSISVPAAGAAFSTISLSASGNTTGATSSGTMNNVMAFSGMGVVSVGVGNGTVSISAPAAAAGTVSMTALGNTTASSSGTYSGLLNVSGAGGVSVGAGAQSLTISGPTQTTLVAGANISLTSGGSSITIIGLPAPISLTQNVDLGLVGGTIVSKSGTVTGTAGVGSSLFLERIRIPGNMTVSEIDAAMSIGFPVTSQGAGTMSRSFVLYSFGNSTSLASVMSASGTSSWGTGTATAGASASLTQFQGGWSSPLIQPFTFASSSVSPGDYVVGQIFNFAQASSTWTLNFYGAQPVSSAAMLSSGGLIAASGVTGSSKLDSGYWPMLQSAGFTGSASMSAGTYTAGSSASTSNTKNLNISVFASASSAQWNVVMAISNTTGLPIYSVGTQAGSIFSASTSLAGAAIALPNFGFIGTGSTTSNFPYYFSNGIMSTGAIPTAITLTSTAVTMSGSVAFQQPWLALVGL